MRNLMSLATAAVLIFAAAGVLPSVNADSWNQLTEVTFSAPVEVPGQVLPAGTYWFKLLNSESNRNLVQVYNASRTRQIALLMTVPDYRLRPAGKTIIAFEERASNSPEAIRAWFYPGDRWGQQFVYPKYRARELAKTVSQPVLSMPNNLEANTKMTVNSPTETPAVAMQQAPVMAEQPTGEEVAATQVVQTPPQLLAQNRQSGDTPVETPARTTPVEKLPATASTIPSAGLLGLTLLCVGALLHFSRRGAE